MSIRFWTIYGSLVAIALTIAAFLLGPLWGLRLDYEKGQQWQLIQTIVPLFASYVSAAVVYATTGKPTSEPRGQRGKILRVTAIGSSLLFVAGMLIATTMYYFSANGTLQHGQLDFDRYSTVITFLLGLLGATTSGITATIFSGKP